MYPPAPPPPKKRIGKSTKETPVEKISVWQSVIKEEEEEDEEVVVVVGGLEQWEAKMRSSQPTPEF